jgi:hypothetical protein
MDFDAIDKAMVKAQLMFSTISMASRDARWVACRYGINFGWQQKLQVHFSPAHPNNSIGYDM